MTHSEKYNEIDMLKMFMAYLNLDNGIRKGKPVKEKKMKYYRGSFTDSRGQVHEHRFMCRNEAEFQDAYFKWRLEEEQKGAVSVTIDEYFHDDYIQSKKFLKTKRPTARARDIFWFEHYVSPYVGHLTFNALNLDAIQSMVDSLTSKKLTVKTIKDAISILSVTCEYAVANRILNVNPVTLSKGALVVTGEPNGHHKPLTNDDHMIAAQNIPQLENERERLYMSFLFYGGMRRSEIIGMKWEDLSDWKENGYFLIQRVVNYPNKQSRPVVEEGIAKSKTSLRRIDICKPFADVLEGIHFKDSGWIFPAMHNPDVPLSNSSMKRLWKNAMKHAGLEGYNNHDFRTNFATRTKMSGATDDAVAKLMGHANSKITTDVYIQLSDDYQSKQNTKILDEAFACTA